MWAPVAGVGTLPSLVSLTGICLLQQRTFKPRSWALGLAFCSVLFSPFSQPRGAGLSPFQELGGLGRSWSSCKSGRESPL